MPFFIHWPAGGLTKEYDVDILTHMVDFVPTLLDLTGVKNPEALKFDGLSIKSLLKPTKEGIQWPDRCVISDSQRVRDPIK